MHAKKPIKKNLGGRWTIALSFDALKEIEAEAEQQGLSKSDYGRLMVAERRRASDRKRLNQLINLVAYMAHRQGITASEVKRALYGEEGEDSSE